MQTERRDLVYFKEAEQIGKRVDDKTAELRGHQRRNAREEFTHDVRRVVLIRRNKMLPQLLLVHKQPSARRNPPAYSTTTLHTGKYNVVNCNCQSQKFQG